MGGGAITDGTCEWEVMSDSDLPSNVHETLVVPSGGHITINNDGYIRAIADAGNHLIIQNNSTLLYFEVAPQSELSKGFVPVKHGDSVYLSEDQVRAVNFVYSVKSAKELGLL